MLIFRVASPDDLPMLLATLEREIDALGDDVTYSLIAADDRTVKVFGVFDEDEATSLIDSVGFWASFECDVAREERAPFEAVPMLMVEG